METLRINAPYASVSRRFAALILDTIIVAIPCAIAAHIIPIIGGLLAAVLYAPVLESSSAQATIGKRLMGIKVEDMEGRAIPFRAALIRYFMKIVSSMICFLGYVLVIFTERRQTLHDLVAETVVVEGKANGPIVDAWINQMKFLIRRISA